MLLNLLTSASNNNNASEGGWVIWVVFAVAIIAMINSIIISKTEYLLKDTDKQAGEDRHLLRYKGQSVLRQSNECFLIDSHYYKDRGWLW